MLSAMTTLFGSATPCKRYFKLAQIFDFAYIN
jgi:hypothetical protein